MKKLKVLLSGKKEQTKNYQNALKKVNITPVYTLDDSIDGLLLTGGGDISPCHYSKTNLGSKNIDIYRDCYEFFLIKKFLSSNKPIFGICRGLQVINVFFGGSLNQNIKEKTHSQINGKDQKHVNKSIISTFCHTIYGNLFLSNSAHHQSILKLGKNLKVSAQALDGCVEAIEGENIYAVQFHPERMNEKFLLNTFNFFACKMY